MHANRYELGNRDLVPQRNYELDVSGHFHTNIFVFDLSAFYNKINNYIFLSPTQDTVKNGDPLFLYKQIDASIAGIETGVRYLPTEWINLSSSYAYLRGKKENDENLPFIPANKLNTGIKLINKKRANIPAGFFSLSSQYAFDQSNPSRFETETNNYFLLNSSIGMTFEVADGKIDLQAGVNNLLNQDYDDHLSTIKVLPYGNMGRNMYGKLKFSF